MNFGKRVIINNLLLGSVKPSNLRAKFENMAKQGEEEARKRAEEEKEKRKLREKLEAEEAKRREEKKMQELKDQEKVVRSDVRS